MSRWFTIAYDGSPFDNENAFFFTEGQFVNGTGASTTRETTVKRSGTASRAHNAGSSASNSYTLVFWGLQGQNGYFIRIYFRVTALPTALTSILILADEGVNLVSARLTDTGKIQLWNDVATSQIGSDSSATIATGTWYRLELACKTVSGSSDTTSLQLDGTSVASATGLALGESHVSRAYHGWVGSPAANAIIYIDDVAVNDDLGGSQNSFPGEGSIVYLDPISDNARGANWTGGAGGTTNLFAAVDNNPQSGVASGSATDTSQIKNTNTADTTGNYDANMTSYTTAGVGASDTVTVVQAVASSASSSATNVSGAIQLVSNPAGSENAKAIGVGAGAGTYGTGWHGIWGTAEYGPSVTKGTSPVLRVGRRGTESAEQHHAMMRIAVEYLIGGSAPGINFLTTRGVG